MREEVTLDMSAWGFSWWTALAVIAMIVLIVLCVRRDRGRR